MQQHHDNSASGYLTNPFEGIGREFSDVEIIATLEVNVVAKAKRYGKWWLLTRVWLSSLRLSLRRC